MTLFEVAIYGPTYCLLAAFIARELLRVAEGFDHPWAGKIAIATAFVAATGITWGIGNLTACCEEPPGPAYSEVTDWRGYDYTY